MRRARRLLEALAFMLAMVLGFMLVVGLSGCERRAAPWAGAPASAPSSPLSPSSSSAPSAPPRPAAAASRQ